MFILTACVLRKWEAADWPHPAVTAVLAWSTSLAYGEISNLAYKHVVSVRDGMDALSVQVFVSAAQDNVLGGVVVPRVRLHRLIQYSCAIAAMLWYVWRHDSSVTVNPCVATGVFILLGRRDVLGLVSVLSCVPIAWHMPGAWSAAACLRGLLVVAWLACAMATPPWLQCAVFAIAGQGCHPGLLATALVVRRLPRVIPVLALGIGAL